MYPDAGGWAIGYGHNLKYPICQKAAEEILIGDYIEAIKGFYKLPHDARKSLSINRREVMVEMIFQLGLRGVINFKKMIAALVACDYNEAAKQILDSNAARQCPGRFNEYADIMRKG
jgi:GH24 family phage-related lysozyme (muramidase)